MTPEEIAESTAEVLAAEEESYALRRELLEESLAAQGEVTAESYAELEDMAKEHQDNMSSILESGLSARMKVMKVESMSRAQQAKEIKAFYADVVKAQSGAYGQQAKNEKDKLKSLQASYAEKMKIMADAVSNEIIASGASAAAQAYNEGGGFPGGIPMAAATMTFYAGLATAVSGLGVAASSALAPSGGGGGGAPETEKELPSDGAVPDIATPAEEAVSLGAASGPSMVVNISGSDILQRDEVVKAIAEEIKKYEES